MSTSGAAPVDPAAVRLAAVVEALHEPVLVLSAGGRIRLANAAFHHLVELPAAAVVGRELGALAGGRRVLARLGELAAAVAADGSERRDVRIEGAPAAGPPRALLVNARRLGGDGGGAAVLLAIADATERERQVWELEAEKEYAEKIVDASREALLILGWDLRVRTANLTFYETFAIDPADTEGRPVFALGGGAWDIPRLRELLETILPANDSFDDVEIEHEFADLGRRVMVLNARRIDHTRLILLAIEDVTERRRSAAALRASEARLRVLVESFAQIVWETDARGHLLGDVPGWRAWTGQTLDDLLAGRWHEAIHPDDRDAFVRTWRAHLASGEELAAEYRLRSARGGWWWSQVRAAPIRDERGRVVTWVGMNVDVTARRTAEEERELLLAELNHRVRNLFSVLRSLARQAGRAADVPAFQALFLARLDALSRAYTLALDHRWQRVDLRTLVDLAVEPFDGESRVVVDGPPVALDAKRALSLGLALHELATNAVKHGALAVAGGRVRLAWAVAPGEAGSTVHLSWREEHGPAVHPPARRGFGTRLIEGTFGHELGGDVRLDFAASGFTLEATWAMAP
jgi:PAS domain S-box-containing protein